MKKIKDPWYTEWTTRVSTTEYDWRGQFMKTVKFANKNKMQTIDLDVGKVAGLCAYIDKLEEEIYQLNRDKGFKIMCMNCGSTNTDTDYDDDVLESRHYCKDCGQSQ